MIPERRGGGGVGVVLLGILGGVCSPVLQILTQLCHFSHSFSDQTSKIHTRFQA